jgi:hypothetical protein
VTLVITGAGGSGLITRLNAEIEDKPSLPVTCTLKLAVPLPTGAPLIVPPLLKFKPEGRVPVAIDHV